MTREDIIRMAHEAEFPIKEWGKDETLILARHSRGAFVVLNEKLERFAQLVAAAEREACAKVCADLITPWDENTPNRGAVSLVNDGMRQCAAAIRARGQQ